jgi:hypothetical protein
VFTRLRFFLPIGTTCSMQSSGRGGADRSNIGSLSLILKYGKAYLEVWKSVGHKIESSTYCNSSLLVPRR